MTASTMVLVLLAAQATAQKTDPAQTATAPRAQPPTWAELSDQDRAELVRAAASRTLRERLLAHSARFLGTRYLDSPLGEGEGFDPDPTVRYDAVDCLTMVEQTIALALARDASQVPDLLDALRYSTRRAYEDRNHLMEAQWIPNNVAKGFLRDVTERYAGEPANVELASKVITRTTWQSISSSALQLPRARQLVGEFPLRMIRLDRFRERAREIPSGTVLLVVRDERPLKATRISHLGFVVQKRKRAYLRHAARNGYARVVDEDLETFLTRNSKYAKWPVIGVSLLEVTAPRSHSR